jgi:hypothetical protein
MSAAQSDSDPGKTALDGVWVALRNYLKMLPMACFWHRSEPFDIRCPPFSEAKATQRRCFAKSVQCRWLPERTFTI